ncbi:MAG: V-type ATP synthase subunit D [Candidatus Omnitrophota bacterium]|jgi:V/A-type H+-transporting ATPase subunit D|nr:V-type ATP synthase subunit D [Candidatus Omnitrophota bacterium]
MRVNVAATKTNLLKMRKSLELTREGYELLDEKRRILINELTSLVRVMDRLQRQAYESLRLGYAALEQAVVAMGRRKVEELSLSVDTEQTIRISQRRVMGVSLPVIDAKVKQNSPYFSCPGVSFYVDETITRFSSFVEILASLAEKKIAVLRLAREVKKTIRKVNALEKIYLPYYKDGVKYINDRLDEESRDAFSMLKIIKKNLAH